MNIHILKSYYFFPKDKKLAPISPLPLRSSRVLIFKHMSHPPSTLCIVCTCPCNIDKSPHALDHPRRRERKRARERERERERRASCLRGQVTPHPCQVSLREGSRSYLLSLSFSRFQTRVVAVMLFHTACITDFLWISFLVFFWGGGGGRGARLSSLAIVYEIVKVCNFWWGLFTRKKLYALRKCI